MMKVGITGGIGSGKSTVCRLFARLGVAVYDSDAGAKRLMTEDAELRQRITDRFGAEAYADGTLNRTYLAGRVFSEAQARAVWSIRSRIYVVSRFLPDSSAISCRSFFAFW